MVVSLLLLAVDVCRGRRIHGHMKRGKSIVCCGNARLDAPAEAVRMGFVVFSKIIIDGI